MCVAPCRLRPCIDADCSNRRGGAWGQPPASPVARSCAEAVDAVMENTWGSRDDGRGACALRHVPRRGSPRHVAVDHDVSMDGSPVNDESTRTAYRTCPLCEATCGLEITVTGDRVTRIRGDRDDVFSHGFVCPKGSTLKQLHEDPDRLRAPLVRRERTARGGHLGGGVRRGRAAPAADHRDARARRGRRVLRQPERPLAGRRSTSRRWRRRWRRRTCTAPAPSTNDPRSCRRR